MSSVRSSTPVQVHGSAKRVKFVASDPTRGGLPVKRKQVQQACDSCRRKKRRCIHADDAARDESLAEEHTHDSSTSPQLSAAHAPNVTLGTRTALAGENGINGSTPTGSYGDAVPADDVSPSKIVANGEVSVQSSRFVGDLNPEGIFMEATASATARQAAQNGDVGIWLSSATLSSSNNCSQFITSRPPPIMDRFLLPWVREHCLSCLPPEQDWIRLKSLYVRMVHPLFPIISLEALNGPLDDDPCNVVLRQLVCLAAGTDCHVSSHLRLQNKGTNIMTPQDFGQALSSAVRAILETSIITDRVLHIQALTMLSLFAQPTCAEEADLNAQLGGRAIHHIQTLGLHLLRYDAPNCDDLNNLFCAVWALDRMNGAMYGRPCLLHERDIGANLEACIKKAPPCFRLLLMVVQWLDEVVGLYRPGPSAEASGLEKVAYIDLPVLEAMIVQADALKVDSSLIATIETFYHAVIILSCRLPRPGTITAASTLPPPSANARRSLAAERIACAVPRDCLAPMPFVSYAISLSLSVEYRKMRHSRLPMFRARAMDAFKRNCHMLRDFADYYWSANVVLRLGEAVLKEMEKAATTLTREASPLHADGDAKVAANGDHVAALPQATFNVGEQPTTNLTAGIDNIIDFSLIDAVSGHDVFGLIDPNFNLGAIEDALEANLDIGLPLNWGDWGQFAT